LISTFLLTLFINVAIRMFSLKIRYTHCLIIIINLLSNKHPYMFVTRKKQKQQKTTKKTNVNKISQFIMNKLRDFCPQF
jgi:hypothetical protein